MERFKPSNLDTLDPNQVLDAYAVQEDKGFVSTGNELPQFTTRPNAPKDYGLIPHTEEEFRKVQQAIMADEDDRGRCKPEMFEDLEWSVRWLKAVTVNLYYEYRGNWTLMGRDPRCVTDSTLRRYWQDSKFRLYIMAFDDIFNLKAKAVITDLLESTDERVKLAAAQTWLRANQAETWDPGVKKQIVANKGSIANTFFKQVVSEKDFTKTLASDPFSQLTPMARDELRASIGLESSDTRTIELPKDVSPVISPTMPKDPFTLNQVEEE